MNRCLLLNRSHQPIDIISWQRAITLWYSDKAEIIKSYDNQYLHSSSMRMKVPCVIVLKIFNTPNKKIKMFKAINKENVWIRDKGTCMYCGMKVSKNKFTFDHVIPKSRGGLRSWKNIVCCCQECNNKKGNRTPTEAGMKLIQKPFIPIIGNSYYECVNVKMKETLNNINNNIWNEYLY